MKSLKKILIVRFSSIGDIVLTTPVIRCLQLQLGAEIHFLCKKVFSEVISANPYISKIYTIQKEITEILPQLKKENYDCIIDLHKNIRTARLKLALKKTSYTFDKINLEKWLKVRFKIDRLPQLHIVDRYLAAVQTLGVKNDHQGLDYFIPQESVITKEQLQKRFPKHSNILSNYLAFVIGAAHTTKRIPNKKIIAICQKINQPIILIGGKSEVKDGDHIAVTSGTHVLNACGQFSISESASIIQQAYKVITPDTGMMHIAAAFGKEIISIWGNTIPEFGMYPYLPKTGKNTSFEVTTSLSCRPCSKIGFSKCPKGHFRCMEQQDVKTIIEAIL